MNRHTIIGKHVGQFEGINVYESKLLGNIHGKCYGVAIPKRGIIVGKGTFTCGVKDGMQMMQHEFGHILQYRKYGSLVYWLVIAPESFINAVYFPLSHYSFWIETWANHLSKEYFSKSWIGGTGYPTQNISTDKLKKIMNVQSLFKR